MRKGSAAAGLAALLLFGVGCTSVPTSGRATVVRAAPTAGVAEDTQDLQQGRKAGAPVPADATPEVIVDGFLGAEQDTSADGTLLAQDYLTTPTVWDDLGETVVYTSKEVVPLPSANPAERKVQVTYSLLARITLDGDYRPDVSRLKQIFEVSLQPNGWRISALPRGRRINNTDLPQVFRRAVRYFYSSREYDTLVPEPIYLLNQSSTRVRSLVESLVAGPSPQLADFLPPSKFPPGTQLLSAPEPENNIAELSFNTELDNAPMADRPKIVAQIVWTLTALDSRIDAVTIKVDGDPFKFDSRSDAPLPQTQEKWTAYDPEGPYAHRTSYFNLGGTLGSYRRSSAVHTGRPLGPLAGKPAVSPDGASVAVAGQAAGLHELRVGPVKAGALISQSKSELPLTDPSWGTAQDGVWVVTQEGNGAPVLFSVPGGARDNRTVRAAELDSRVYAFEVAPDGLRVAAIVERGGERSLEIGFIERPSIDGAARRVGGFRPVVSAGNVSPLSVAWLDSGKLAFIGQRGAEDPAVFTVRIDGTQLKRSEGSRELLHTAVSPAIAPQLIAVAVPPDSARRGDGTSPDQMLLVIDDATIYINRGLEWMRLPDRSRNQ